VSPADRLREQLAENRAGMLYDFVFAVAWVAFVSFLFDVVFTSAPTWAFYMFMLAGIPAYFGFFWSFELAKQSR
jgi:hypothetical protein